MPTKQAKKLKLSRETLRSLSGHGLSRVAGGISGLKGCHSIQDVCEPDSGGALCVSVGICPTQVFGCHDDDP